VEEYKLYSKCIARSVDHIFKNFLSDHSIEEIFETQSGPKDPSVAVEINGTLKGELIINMPESTLIAITKLFIGKSDKVSVKNSFHDVAGELANLITAAFANQLQYANHELLLNAPEFNDDPISVKALYENINLSFNSRFGGFDIDFYYRDPD
jgi:CheY-specific phosphatase CheX